jgi:hypothetical protein
MPLPSADTPLYNHPLPDIEQWLSDQGCEQDHEELHCWHLKKVDWQADIFLEVDQVKVRYLEQGNPDRPIQRSFKYSLSRQDIENAVFSGP